MKPSTLPPDFLQSPSASGWVITLRWCLSRHQQYRMARNIAESDFWQSGIRGVLFGEASRQLMAGGAQVFIISSGGAADGQH